MSETIFNHPILFHCFASYLKDSQVVCSLKDIFSDVIELKNKEKHTLKNKKEIEKYLDETLEVCCFFYLLIIINWTSFYVYFLRSMFQQLKFNVIF